MKNRFIFLGIAIVLLGASVFIMLKQKPRPVFTFVERIEGSTNDAEWLNAKAAIQQLLVVIKKNPQNLKAKLKLANLYINEGRVSGNHAYYDAAAMQLIEDILDEEENNFDALCAQATILLSQHHFNEAETVGLKLVKQNPHSAYALGILVDAYVELGKYEKAIVAADNMTALRPDIRSYARIAYLREIIGDYQGAIESMEMAVNAGIKGLEQTEWCRYNLGKLYEHTGKHTLAKNCYELCLLYRNNYAYGNAGLGSIAHIEGNLQTAVTYYKRAKASVNDFSFSEALYQIYKTSGQMNLANAQLMEAEKLLGANDVNENETHGHYADKELAELYTTANLYDKALTHAMLEYNRRPDNAEVNRTLAWVYFHKKQYKLADELMQVALKPGTQNPETLLQAAAIKMKLNFKTEASQYIQRAYTVSKIWSVNANEILKYIPAQMHLTLNNISK